MTRAASPPMLVCTTLRMVRRAGSVPRSWSIAPFTGAAAQVASQWPVEWARAAGVRATPCGPEAATVFGGPENSREPANATTAASAAVPAMRAMKRAYSRRLGMDGVSPCSFVGLNHDAAGLGELNMRPGSRSGRTR